MHPIMIYLTIGLFVTVCSLGCVLLLRKIGKSDPEQDRLLERVPLPLVVIVLILAWPLAIGKAIANRTDKREDH